MSSSKAGKILRRTLSGGALALGVAGTLWLTSRSEDGRPIFFAAAIVLFGAVFELVRMGRLRDLDLAPAMLAAALGVLVLADLAIEGMHDVRYYATEVKRYFPGIESRAYHASLFVEYAAAVLLAMAAASWFASLRRMRAEPRLARVLFWIGFLALVWFVRAGRSAAVPRLEAALFPVAIVALAGLPSILGRANGLRDLAIAAGLALWLVPPLPGLWSVLQAWGIQGLVALLLLSKIGDTAGYYVGSAIGRSHPFPIISPGKTTAGCFGSFITATAIGGLMVELELLPGAHLGLAGGFLAGAVVNLAAQAGDLLESWIKRRAGVKDSSSLFGPSGGILDQIDSLLVSIPAAAATWPWIFAAR